MKTEKDASETPDLDTVTALRLGDALWRFLARLNAESDTDAFTWEDAGVLVTDGFIEIDREALEAVSLLLEQMPQKADSEAGQ